MAQNQSSVPRITGVIEMTQTVNYPIIVYNTYLPDNSELVVTNLAEKQKKSQVISLGQHLRFVSFVQSPYLLDYFTDRGQIKSNDCMVYFLAWHKGKKKLQLVVLSCDPWELDKKLHLHRVQTGRIELPRRPLEQLKRAFLLTSNLQKRIFQSTIQFRLVCQYEDNIWTIEMRKKISNTITATFTD